MEVGSLPPLLSRLIITVPGFISAARDPGAGEISSLYTFPLVIESSRDEVACSSASIVQLPTLCNGTELTRTPVARSDINLRSGYPALSTTQLLRTYWL